MAAFFLSCLRGETMSPPIAVLSWSPDALHGFDVALDEFNAHVLVQSPRNEHFAAEPDKVGMAAKRIQAEQLGGGDFAIVAQHVEVGFPDVVIVLLVELRAAVVGQHHQADADGFGLLVAFGAELKTVGFIAVRLFLPLFQPEQIR